MLTFSTSLLAEFISYRLALFVYWLNIFAGGALIYACWAYARRAGRSAALLCVINTYVSIAFIVLVQLNYALGLRIPVISRLTS